MLNFPAHHRSPHLLSALIVDHHRQSLDAIASRDPSPAVALARQDLIVLLSDHTGLTQAEIGAALDRTESTVSHILRTAKTLATNDPATANRLALLRAAALCLPTEVDLLDPSANTPEETARRVVSRSAFPDAAIDRLALAILCAAEVLKARSVGDFEARQAALAVLTDCEPAMSAPAQIIPLKGTVK